MADRSENNTFGIISKLRNFLDNTISSSQRFHFKRKIAPLFQIPVLGDAYHFIYYQWIRKNKIRPKSIGIETTNICNLRCIMCPYPRMTRKKEKMGMPLFKKILDDALAFGVKDLELNMYGEPLLDDLIFERIRYAKEKGFYVQLFSNGTLLLLENRISRLLESGLDRIIFSIDSVDQTVYEQIRTGAKYSVVIDGITELLEEKHRRGCNSLAIAVYCVLQRKNYKSVPDLRRQFRQVLPGIGLIQFGLVDSRANEEELIPDSKCITNSPRFTYPCRRLWEQIYITVNGTVCLCSQDFNGQINLGDLNANTLLEIWEMEPYHTIRNIHLSGNGRQMEMCNKCPILNYDALTRWLSTGF